MGRYEVALGPDPSVIATAARLERELSALVAALPV